MSLGPYEHRVLAQIEESLRRSDPKLATMLSSFKLRPFSRMASGLTVAAPWHARFRRALPALVGCLIIALIGVGFVVLGRATHVAVGTAGCKVAPVQVTACHQPGHQASLQGR